MQRGARSIIYVINRFWACTEKRSHHIGEATSDKKKSERKTVRVILHTHVCGVMNDGNWLLPQVDLIHHYFIFLLLFLTKPAILGTHLICDQIAN